LDLNDDRFNYKNFGKQPVWLIREAIRSGQQKRNLDHLTISRLLHSFIQANSGKPPELSNLLPHPRIWKEEIEDDNLNISKQTARDILNAIDSNWLDSSHSAMLDNYMSTIKSIAGR
jgi:hypothetical protein